MTVQESFNIAIKHHQAGRLDEAESLYRQILAGQPNHAEALRLQGLISLQLGRKRLAVDLIGRAVALRPGWAEALGDLGDAFMGTGQLDQAISAYRQSLALKPNNAAAIGNLGLALLYKGLTEEAISAYRQALALKPDYPEALSNLGISLRRKGQLDEAIASFQRAIVIRPHFAQAHSNLGNALRARGNFDEAIAAYRRAVALQPNDPDAYVNLSIVLSETRQLDDAIAASRQAIALRADLAEAHVSLGMALKNKGQLDEAVSAYRRAIAIKSNIPEVYNNLGNVLLDRGEINEALEAYRQAVSLNAGYAEAHSNLIYAMHFDPRCETRTIAGELRSWNERHARPWKRAGAPHGNTPEPNRRLRIGYVSPDLCAHPVGRFLKPLFQHHDREAFTTFAYAHVPVPDAMTHELRAATGQWRDIVSLSDEQAADLIRQDQIDILVDLTMHSAHNRLLVFARKPAPVQATYLAYCSSTGLEAIDYRFSDPWLDQPAEAEAIYSEKTIYLPETYWCYAPLYLAPEVTPVPALQHGNITFGCLNKFCKVSDGALAAWAKLLHAVPSSRLLLYAQQGGHRLRVADQLKREGIEPGRLEFVGFMPGREYFESYGQIDIALDTFPFGGGTTTCDALWMGVPTVSLAGQTAVGRGGLSILSNVGLPELVVRSEEQYVQIAAGLANDLPRLIDLRSTLRRRLERSPLMDAFRFTRNVESLYRRIWQTWCESVR